MENSMQFLVSYTDNPKIDPEYHKKMDKQYPKSIRNNKIVRFLRTLFSDSNF